METEYQIEVLNLVLPWVICIAGGIVIYAILWALVKLIGLWLTDAEDKEER